MSTIITKRQFPNYHKYEMELAGRPLTIGYIFYDTRLRPTDIRSLTIPIYQ